MLTTILLQAGAQGGFDMSFILMMVAFFVIIYFFMIRPQNKRQKKIREARASMQKGDKVITSGGIYGRIKEVKDTTFVITVADGVNVTVEKNCIYPVADADAAIQDGQAKAQQQ